MIMSFRGMRVGERECHEWHMLDGSIIKVYQDAMRSRSNRFPYSTPAKGKITVKVVPLPISLFTLISPLCFLIIL